MSPVGGYDDDRPGPEDELFYGGTGTTRTRLPDGSGDGYGAPRRAARPSRSLVTVVGVVVLLIAAIAFANQGGGDADSSGSGGSQAGSNPTAPSGEDPVKDQKAGIPTGYAHNASGAQSAATNYGVALGSAEMFDAGRRTEIVDTVYTRAVATARKGDLDKAYSDKDFLGRIGLQADGTAPKGMTFISRVIPVGTKTTKYGGDSATVELWYSSLFGLAGDGSEHPVTESWYTTTYEMKWENGDWKVADFEQKDGPVPVGKDQTASTAKDMAEAVEEFGGFTYAR
ncbi:hypothetical protein H9Y04_42150 [Streptomyces sp. TRM66268-LWL]|uniref:DUF8175 domain-containing protein n=1 Tax=Streptomyces polyasparticus TaxID=2767826 RepID=A0ABR7SUE9_9ACTN|nr:hypothetical protein [Streptomyces polyasparticus]MBC9719134.1 hypothetical protein [Streptomyces polyasparticus]